MAYGIQTSKGGLTTLSNTLLGGRVFVELIYYESETAGTTHTHTYTNIPGHTYLRVHQIGGGTHSWALSTNGSGHAVVTLTALTTASSLDVPFTLLIVFSLRTSESGYGVLTTNDSGDTVVSAVYEVPEFVGTVTPSSTASSSVATGEGSYYLNIHEGTTSAGASRERLIFWVLPRTSEDVWFNGQSHISSAVSGSTTVSIQYIAPASTPYIMPVGYIFALTGLAESSDAYGLQVFDASGNPTFDSGKEHLVLDALESVVDYPTTTGTTNYYSLPSIANVDFPAGTFPQFRQEKYQNPTAYLHAGVCRFNLAGVETRLMRTQTYGTAVTATYNYGTYTNLVQAVTDSAKYGSTSFALAGRTFQYDATAYCAYDTSLGQTSCTSSSYHTVRWRGGRAGTVSFSWSLPSNAGGLSIVGSTTGVDVLLQKTATGSVTPGTTYSCTLRCAITIDGETVNVDRTVTHTHEEFASGGGGGDTGGGGDSGDSGDSGGSKIVCSAMNDRFGLPRRENLIWLKYSKEHLKPEHERGYHKWCGPLVKYSFKSGEGPLKTLVRNSLIWIAKTRTQDILNELDNKPRNPLHRAVRWFVEELSYQVGKRMD